MVLLVCFDLPRITKEERKQASRYRKHLLELGFTMKQFSVYERSVRNHRNVVRIVEILREELPETGAITLYELPDNVSDNQITILGAKNFRKSVKEPRFIEL